MVLSPECVLIAEKGRGKGKQNHALTGSRCRQSVERSGVPFNIGRSPASGS